MPNRVLQEPTNQAREKRGVLQVLLMAIAPGARQIVFPPVVPAEVIRS